MADTEHTQFKIAYTIARADMQHLFTALHARGYETIGPTVRDGVVAYDVVENVDELPAGWADEQEGGYYRLHPGNDGALFGYTTGPQAWKRYLFPPVMRMWQARRSDNGFEIVVEERTPPKYAFIGVRACELHAIQIQDRVFLDGPYVDAEYKQRRDNAFIVAVNCGRASGTCFCVSMGTGPAAGPGYDLALTEIVDQDTHCFIVDVGSEQGASILLDVPHRPATRAETERAAAIVEATAAHMGRTLETTGLKELLYRNFDHPQWDALAERCLTCGNCTLVCPTCFCHTLEDVTDLTGQTAERWRKADSCFNLSFSFISSGSVRASARSRYRQWMTHKLATWVDQFGTFGCVGCGRCITWCPVGIDITAAAATLREDDIGQPQVEPIHQMA